MQNGESQTRKGKNEIENLRMSLLIGNAPTTFFLFWMGSGIGRRMFPDIEDAEGITTFLLWYSIFRLTLSISSALLLFLTEKYPQEEEKRARKSRNEDFRRTCLGIRGNVKPWERYGRKGRHRSGVFLCKRSFVEHKCSIKQIRRNTTLLNPC